MSSARRSEPDTEKRTESGISLRIPVVLVVGVGDDVATACARAAEGADVEFLRVAQGVAACRAIRDARPTVVALAPGLWRDETRAISDAARAVGARVIDLPPFAPPSWIALRLVRVALEPEPPPRE